MKLALTPLAFAASVSAHAIFQQLYVNGKTPGHTVAIRAPNYEGPIIDVTSTDLVCNGGNNSFYQPVSQTVYDVPAGSTFTAQWHHTIVGAIPGDDEEPIAANHKGPVVTYLAKVADAANASVSGLQWFKIWEDGFNPRDQSWGVDRLRANAGLVNFTIPACILPGQYLLRHEVIALHDAQVYPGAQFYMSCAQINILGGGKAQPPTVQFPGAYSPTDPGITINIYQTLKSYAIPGPPVFRC